MFSHVFGTHTSRYSMALGLGGFFCIVGDLIFPLKKMWGFFLRESTVSSHMVASGFSSRYTRILTPLGLGAYKAVKKCAV